MHRSSHRFLVAGCIAASFALCLFLAWSCAAPRQTNVAKAAGEGYFPVPDSQGGWRLADEETLKRLVPNPSSLDDALDYAGRTSKNGGLLVIRDVFNGRRRFGLMQRSLGIARNILSNRLDRLVADDILERRLYQERPPRHEYFLTEKGLDLWPVMVTLMQFGDRYYAPDGPPVVLTHRDCGGTLDAHRTCTTCGAKLTARDVRARAGPGAVVA